MSIRSFFKTKSPLLLAIGSCAGVVATGILSARAARKAAEIVDPQTYAVSLRYEIQKTWKCYIPPVATGLATISCIIGSYALGNKQQASLIAAYTLLDQTYREYRKKVVEHYGENADLEIEAETAISQADDPPAPTKSDQALFLDSFSHRYIWKTPLEVTEAEYHFNRNFILRGYATLNEFYEFLGLPPIDGGDEIGWSDYVGETCYGYKFVDFENIIVSPDDQQVSMDLPEDFNYEVNPDDHSVKDIPVIYMIHMPFPPHADFLDDPYDEDGNAPTAFTEQLAEIASPIVKGGES